MFHWVCLLRRRSLWFAYVIVYKKLFMCTYITLSHDILISMNELLHFLLLIKHRMYVNSVLHISLYIFPFLRICTLKLNFNLLLYFNSSVFYLAKKWIDNYKNSSNRWFRAINSATSFNTIYAFKFTRYFQVFCLDVKLF